MSKRKYGTYFQKFPDDHKPKLDLVDEETGMGKDIRRKRMDLHHLIEYKRDPKRLKPSYIPPRIISDGHKILLDIQQPKEKSSDIDISYRYIYDSDKHTMTVIKPFDDGGKKTEKVYSNVICDDNGFLWYRRTLSGGESLSTYMGRLVEMWFEPVESI